MELDKLKEAISNIKEFYGDALYSKDAGVVTKAVQELLSLASSIIAVSGILSVEDIRRIIIDKELVPRVCEDSGQAEWTVGESKKLAEAIYHRVAIALAERFLGKDIRFNFKCGCFLLVFLGENDLKFKAALSCCLKHEHPYAKTKEFYLSKFDDKKLDVVDLAHLIMENSYMDTGEADKLAHAIREHFMGG